MSDKLIRISSRDSKSIDRLTGRLNSSALIRPVLPRVADEDGVSHVRAAHAGQLFGVA